MTCELIGSIIGVGDTARRLLDPMGGGAGIEAIASNSAGGAGGGGAGMT